MARRRLDHTFWFGFVAGTGFGIFLLAWFIGNWHAQVGLFDALFFGKILAWTIVVVGFALAVFVGRRKAGPPA